MVRSLPVDVLLVPGLSNLAAAVSDRQTVRDDVPGEGSRVGPGPVLGCVENHVQYGDRKLVGA